MYHDGWISRRSQQRNLDGEPVLNTPRSFLVDSHVNHSVMLGSDEAGKMTVTSGRKCLESCRSSGPLGFLERMLMESPAWDSTMRLLTWRVKITHAGRSLFQLLPSVPRIKGKEFSLLPTPVVNDAKNANLPNAAQERDCIPGYLIRNGYSGKLNPQFIEALMGFPIGWTDCDVLEMPLCHSRCIRSLRQSHKLRRRR